MASAKLLKVLNIPGRRRVEKHHNGEMEPPSRLRGEIEEDLGQKNPGTGTKRQIECERTN